MIPGANVAVTHRMALTATVALGATGIMSGSLTLRTAALGLVALALGTSGFLLRPKPSSLRVAVHAATIAALAMTLAILRTAQIDAVLLIVMLGIANRLLLRNSARDDFVVVAACAVLMVMATTITPGLAFVPLVVTFVPAALWTLAAANVLAEGEVGGQGPAAVRQLARLPAPRFRFGLAAPMVLLMVLGYAVAALFPRYNFGRALSVGAFLPLPGADRSLELRTGGLSLSRDGTVMVRLAPEDGRPLDGALYARLYALDRFERTGWSSSEAKPLEGLRPGSVPPARGTRVEVRLRRLVSRREPHPLVLVGAARASAVGVRRALRDPDGTWYTRVPAAPLDVRYEVDLSRSADPPPPKDPDRFLATPAGLDPRVEQLAARLVAGIDRPKDRVLAVLEHFAEEDYVYSVEPLPGDASDPLVRFLFEAKQGHCELYAGALAALLRLSGVPARVVTGYYGGWWNSRSRELEFTNQDAHAWVEAWVDGAWRWVDATPAESRTRRAGKPFAWLFDRWDWLEGLWYTHVLDFDERRRRELMTRLKARASGALDGADAWLANLGLPGGARGGASILGAFAVSGVGAAAWGLLAWRRRSSRAVQRWGMRLRRRLGLGTELPLREALRRVDLPASARAEALGAIRLYEALRFGPPAARPPLADLARAVRRLRPGPGRSRFADLVGRRP